LTAADVDDTATIIAKANEFDDDRILSLQYLFFC